MSGRELVMRLLEETIRAAKREAERDAVDKAVADAIARKDAETLTRLMREQAEKRDEAE